MLGMALLFLSLGLAAPSFGYPDLGWTALTIAAVLFIAHVTVGIMVMVLDRDGEIDRRILQHAHAT
jgi:hypothetical protein